MAAHRLLCAFLHDGADDRLFVRLLPFPPNPGLAGGWTNGTAVDGPADRFEIAAAEAASERERSRKRSGSERTIEERGRQGEKCPPITRTNPSRSRWTILLAWKRLGPA